MIRILIADDHEVVRMGLRAILEAQPNWEVVAEAGDGREAIEQALSTKPQVAIVDYALPFFNGVEVTRRIRAKLPSTEVLIFTMHDNDTLLRDLLEAGARGFLLKADAKRFIISAVESLAAHRPFFIGKVSEALVESYLARNRKSDSLLSDREREVVQLIAEGHSNKSVADVLHISLKTVETHRASAMRKLNVNSAAGLVRYAVRNKIVEP